jgi:acetate kinase
MQCARRRFQRLLNDQRANHGQPGRISSPDSAVEVWVIQTDEEAMIADHTRGLLFETLSRCDTTE